MNNITIGMLLAIGTVSAAATDMPEKLVQLYNETIAETQLVCTAGDMHSMSVMLDASYIMDRKLPSVKEFESWLHKAFKENDVKDLAEDHWGNKYIYRVLIKNRRYQLISMGPDGKEGTKDDMVKTGP